MTSPHAWIDCTVSSSKPPNTWTLVLGQESRSPKGFASYCSASRAITRTFRDSARITTSWVKPRSVILVLPTDAPPVLLPGTQSIHVLKSDGARMHPCLTPVCTGKKLDMPPSHSTAFSVPEYRPDSSTIGIILHLHHNALETCGLYFCITWCILRRFS